MDASGTDISLRVYLLLSAAVSMCYGCPLSECVCVCVPSPSGMLWVGTVDVHAMDVENVCVCSLCVLIWWLLAISVCLGLKAPVSEGVSGGHLNRICSRIA